MAELVRHKTGMVWTCDGDEEYFMKGVYENMTDGEGVIRSPLVKTIKSECVLERGGLQEREFLNRVSWRNFCSPLDWGSSCKGTVCERCRWTDGRAFV